MLILRKSLFKEILKHCEAEFPNEACGILAGKENLIEKVYEMSNVEESPDSFFMDSGEQLKVLKEIRGSGLVMLAIYHSHVASAAYPSSRDLELAFYPEASYAIISLKDKNLPCIRSFKIKEGNIAEEEIVLED